MISYNYWLDRGWNETQSRDFIAKRQATCTPEIAAKIQTKLKSKSKEEIDAINYKKGNCLRVDWIVANKGLSELEAKEIIHNRCSHAANKKSEKYKLLNKPFSDRQLEYYLEKGMTVEEAKKELKDRQTTTTLQAFVKKYGYEEGVKRYNSRIEKFKENWSQKSDDEKSKINLKRILRNKFFSNESFLFFKQLTSNLNLEKFRVKFGYDEIYIYNDHLKKIFFYDFCIPELKIIIEYHGSLWHANPLKPKTEWKNKLYTYEESLERDKIKRKTAEDLGYIYIEIWDYQRSDNKTINKILNIITKNVTIYDSNTNHTTNS
jgi:hypothetical protein